MDTHIVIFEGPALDALKTELRDILARITLDEHLRTVRFAIDGGQWKVKTGEGMWSRPFGRGEREF